MPVQENSLENPLVKYFGRSLEEIRDADKAYGLKPETVIVVGNGAVDGGWDVAKKAIQRFQIEQPNSVIAGCDFENIQPEKVFAILGTHLRQARAMLLSFRVDKKHGLSDRDIQAVYVNILHALKLKEILSEEYMKSNVALREFPSSIESLLESSGNRCAVVTTNWDPSIWDCDRIENLIYLHGRVCDPLTLVFPGDVVVDNCVWDKVKPNLDIRSTKAGWGELRTLAGRFLAPNASLHFLDTAHGLALDWIKDCEKLIFWGIGLNTYDSEILGLLAAARGLSLDKPKKIVCENPDLGANDLARGLFGGGAAGPAVGGVGAVS